MNCVLQGGLVYLDGQFIRGSVFIRDGVVTAIGDGVPSPTDRVINCTGRHIFPGFTDVHVHLREPGFSYKETMATGTLSAARGGYTAVCAMPNLNPVPDSMPALQTQLDMIARGAVVRVLPYGAITRGQQGSELADMTGMAPHVAGYSDDGRGVQGDALMRQAMLEAKRLGKVVVAHCEDESLPHGAVNDCAWARQQGLSLNDPASEWAQVKRDLKLVRETGCRYHVCHISTGQSARLIRQAKQEGLDVTCETAPHYLLLDDSALKDDGRFKMNPPLRSADDRRALVEALLDGTIDMIATDHAPHSAQEKAGGLKNSMNGVVGLECAFPLLYARLVKPGMLPLKRLIDLLHHQPNRRFDIDTALAVGKPANLCVWDLDRPVRIDPEQFVSLGRSTPFAGEEALGACVLTIADGRIAWQEETP